MTENNGPGYPSSGETKVQGRWYLLIYRPECVILHRLWGKLRPLDRASTKSDFTPPSLTSFLHLTLQKPLWGWEEEKSVFIKVKLDFPSFFSIIVSANGKIFLSSQMYMASPHRRHISFQDFHCILQIFNFFPMHSICTFHQLSFYNPTFDFHFLFNSCILTFL